MEIISAHSPGCSERGVRFYFAVGDKTWLLSLRGRRRGEDIPPRSPRPARRLPGLGSADAGAALGGQSPGGGRVTPRPEPSPSTLQHTHPHFRGSATPAAGALPEGAVRDSSHACSAGKGRGHLQLRTPK